MGNDTNSTGLDVDVVIVGAGMAGLYMLHQLRGLGMSATVLESADDVGGTWYWNRYPGARCDVQSVDYQYKWDPELEAEWEWSEKYATQPEILRYLQHVADRYDLRRDIQFETTVDSASWNDDTSSWAITTVDGTTITARYYIMATGCLSVPKAADVVGRDRFQGDVYYTGRWPHDGVDLTGKRVAVIGTGSSAIQSIPIMAKQADQMTVFQRTANYSVPAYNGPADPERVADKAADRDDYIDRAYWSQVGVPFVVPDKGIWQATPEEIDEALERGWSKGGLFGLTREFNDTIINQSSNDVVAEFIRNKIRATVDDPQTADDLCPYDFPVTSKRLCVDTDYYATYNEPHVRLVNLRRNPIDSITETGIDIVTEEGRESIEFDVIVFATGFDAMTGALVGVDIEGRNGITLKDKWSAGPHTYLGLTSVDFPNLFMITGPGSPSVLSNMSVSIEQHVEWVTDCLRDMQRDGYEVIEPTQLAEDAWGRHVNDCAAITLFPQANSWYMGANVPGKPRVFLPYVGGVGKYRGTCEKVVAEGYLGFRRSGPAGESCNDGIVDRLQPDVAALLDAIAELGLPPMESLGAEGAREFSVASSAQRPPGPEVGEIVDGTLPGAAGDLDYRLYRPATSGPHPVVIYFHGGGWVIGSHVSDDPFCRELCVLSESVVVSVNYRHGPEDRFPAAADDAVAAVQWVAANAAGLGGTDQLVVAGWSAGGNLAAVVAQHTRDHGGPALAGQLLVTPVTDVSTQYPSMAENAEGYILTKSMLEWFYDSYVDPADRGHVRVSPMLADSLAGLPPAAIYTAEFDPLRDEGDAYADALAAAGVQVQHHQCRGQIHTSLTATDMMLSSRSIRASMAEAIQKFFAG